VFDADTAENLWRAPTEVLQAGFQEGYHRTVATSSQLDRPPPARLSREIFEDVSDTEAVIR
jgi:hypothetical protein